MKHILLVWLTLINGQAALAKEDAARDDSICGKVDNPRVSRGLVGFDLLNNGHKLRAVEILDGNLAELALPMVLQAYTTNATICASALPEETEQVDGEEFAAIKAKKNLWLALKRK